MQIGLVGLQYSGKTTLFNTLTKTQQSEAGTQADKANLAVVKVPDERLDKSAAVFNPPKKVYATIEVYDIPGLRVSEDGKVKITSEFLNNVKNNDSLFYVVRQFNNDAVPHPEGSVNPLRDLEFLETEFLLADMALLETRKERLTKELQKSKNEQAKRELPLIEKCLEHIEKELPLRLLAFDETEKKLLAAYQFLTLKPLVVAVNFDEDSIDKVESVVSEIEKAFDKYTLTVIPFFAKFEYELSQMSDEEAEAFMQEFGISESALNKILKTSYQVLGLQSFLTVGEDECRAWTIKKNTTAQEAAGVIHTDFYNKFIRAEVVHYDDFMHYGSFQKCKEAGVWRLEGKDYIVKDGDILSIRHS
ncbi:MAG: redox-regulated ATPase YchF [Ignavibacteria bacterium]|jgi:GTP-binding protein YchF|nr:redox-regulated ATPase YchF [Ignavibacteria bacterium]MCU7501459.1 redox-regulated ATPase YchF [Ignavibacteria bacterium]MCU7516025.1 redox-regulated ATPase YchF [Ignavibacteria bacterium]